MYLKMNDDTLRKLDDDCSSLASFPGPTQLSVTCSMEKREMAWNNLSREQYKGREDLIECRQIMDVPMHVIADQSTVHVAMFEQVGAHSGSLFFEQ